METIYSQIKSIVDDKLPLVSNLSNAAAILFKMDKVNWAGFYLVQNNALYLGPFQGDVACTVIPFDKGVCGKAYRDEKTILVDNVHEFSGHIACSSLSKSEIVVPIIVDGEVKAVIDIDSLVYSRFTNNEAKWLEKIADILAPLFAK